MGLCFKPLSQLPAWISCEEDNACIPVSLSTWARKDRARATWPCPTGWPDPANEQINKPFLQKDGARGLLQLRLPSLTWAPTSWSSPSCRNVGQPFPGPFLENNPIPSRSSSLPQCPIAEKEASRRVRKQTPRYLVEQPIFTYLNHTDSYWMLLWPQFSQAWRRLGRDQTYSEVGHQEPGANFRG